MLMSLVLSFPSAGYDSVIFARSKLYGALFRQIQAVKIKMGKKVLCVEEKDHRVFIYCSDDSFYEGDILVGADGACRGVF